jgi:chromate reductase, NAD(P)H dehydrogenase (quinone)
VRIVGISGSLRQGSYNRALLAAAGAELPAGVELREWRGLEALPAYDQDRDGQLAVPSVEALRRKLTEADAVLIATPEYNHSLPGALKNALDWASRPYPANALRGKPVAVVGASTGLFGAVWAQAELRRVLQAIGARVIETPLSVPSAQTAFTGDGRLRDSELAHVLREIVFELLQHTAAQAA